MSEQKSILASMAALGIPLNELGYDSLTGRLLHKKQWEFVRSKAKRKVIVAGRRGGKTTGVSVLGAHGLYDGRRALYAAPTQEQTEQVWEYLKEYFWQDISSGNIYKNETRKLMDWHGRFRAKTAWDADSLRGDYADLLFLEEYSLMNPDAWDKVGAPMLLDNNGDSVFIFTPRYRNHAYHLYLKAKNNKARWATWHFTSLDNPFLSKEALAEITEDMTEAAYRQEILAEFLEGEGAVFRNLASCMEAKEASKDEHKEHRVVIGIDWGMVNDYTAISIFCADCLREIHHRRFRGIDYPSQVRRIRSIEGDWSVRSGLVELNSIGIANYQYLKEAGSPARGWTMTGTNKPALINNLAVCFEKAEAQWIDNKTWTEELMSFEVKLNRTTYKPTYSAPEGAHDDTVIARALAWMAATSGRHTLA